MKFPRTVAMVMAGGEGTRLAPLTADRSKPAVPFAGRYRIVDFVLSNLFNSEIRSIYLLVQYKSQSLIEHCERAWRLPSLVPGQFVTVVPPQMREGPEWFQGTADAVYQNLNLVAKHAPDLVAVFGADHVYRMDVRQMIDFHRESGADVSIAALPVPRELASSFGVIAADADGRIREFQEKPEAPAPMPSDPARSYASMGNYIFSADVLFRALREARERGESDFGRHVVPRLLREGARVFAYDFAENEVPGIRRYEEPHYWRDVGTIDAFFASNMDTLGLEPRFNLFNPKWTVNSSNYQGPTPKVVAGELKNVILSAGTTVKGARIANSILRREVLVEQGVEIEDSIIMDYVVIRRGARLKKVIVDRYNEIGAGERVGFDGERDASRFHVTESGIAVMPKGQFSAEAYSYG